MHTIEEDRKSRMDHAYNQVGKPILGGALTSCFSAFFLIICDASALSKFGILLLTIIVCSLLTSLVFLPSIAFIIGP